MAKCPNCKHQLLKSEDGKYLCPNCGNKYAIKQKAESAPPVEIDKSAQSRHNEDTYEKKRDSTDEIEALKTRLAMLEKEQNKISNNSPSNHSNKRPKADFSNVLLFFKKNLKIILPAVLFIITFITLMCCLVGIRGVYVNVDDPNDFFSFTATDYIGYSSDDFIGDYQEKGTWKTSGSKLTLTIKDEDFGKISMDYVYSTKNGYKTLFLGESNDSLTEYKRISLVKYPLLTKKNHCHF